MNKDEQPIATASQLVWAVREMDREQVGEVLASVGCGCSCDHTAMHRLILTLAAMAPDDMSPSELMGWLDNPGEYLRLRTAGVGSYAAASLCRDRPADAAA